MTRQISTIEDFLMAVGGYHELSKALDLSAFAIAKWKKRGIPKDYWSIIEKKYGITLAELYHISYKARKDNGFAN